MSPALPIDTQRVMIERRHGWEKAETVTLAAIFGLTRQAVTAITSQTCARCGAVMCGCPDHHWKG